MRRGHADRANESSHTAPPGRECRSPGLDGSAIVRVALVNCVLIDGTGAEPLEDAAIVVDDERIVAVGRSSSVVESPDRVIDLHGMAALPGLINLHVHFGLVLPGALQARYQDESVASLAYRMAQNAREA